MAQTPMMRSAIFDSSMRELSIPTEFISPATKYLMPSSTFSWDSITKMAVAEEKALITGMEMNSKMNPVKIRIILDIFKQAKLLV